MCSICKIPGRSVAYPAFQFVGQDGSLVAGGKTMVVCSEIAKDRAAKNGWTFRLEARRDERALPIATRLANDAVYAAAAAF